jgi:hypothetical protein
MWYLLPGKVHGAFGPDGQFLATTSGDRGALYRVMGCEHPGELCFEPAGVLRGARFYAKGVTWSPDGAQLAGIGDLDAYSFDMSGCGTGQGPCGEWLTTLERVGIPEVTVLGPAPSVDGTGWSVAASGYDNGLLLLWAFDDGRGLRRLQSEHDKVVGLAFHPRAAALASVGSGEGSQVCVWHVLPPLPAADPDALLYSETFSDLEGGWGVYKNEYAQVGYGDGEYKMALKEVGYVVKGQPVPPQDLADFRIEVDAQQVAGPLDGYYGVLIRYQPEAGNYYIFKVAVAGYYGVDLRSQGEWVTLVPWAASDAVKQGLGTSNRLQVLAAGDRFAFYVNDLFLAEVTDDTYHSGTIGLGAGAFEETGVEIHFDNLQVYGLEE